jgi:polyisoprenoid-binding protein YceI
MREYSGAYLFRRILTRPKALIVNLALLILTIQRPAASQQRGSYEIDSSKSRIEIHLFRTGFLGGFGDNHQILLTRFSGKTESSTDNSWSVQITGESASLRVMDPGASASTREQVQHNMLSPNVLDPDQYPSIELHSHSVHAGNSPNALVLTADLTLHGITRQLEFPLTWSQNAGRLQVNGTRRLLLKDFGIQPPRIAMGVVKVKNEFELVYEIVLLKKL